MSDLDQTGTRRDAHVPSGGDFLNVLGRIEILVKLSSNAFAVHVGGSSVSIRLSPSGRQNFIAGLQIHPEQSVAIPMRCR